MNIRQYIDSGIIESYALGLASFEDAVQFERLLPFYPPLKEALSDFEFQLELFSIQNEEPPPPGALSKIQDRLREAPSIIRPVIRPEHSGGTAIKQRTEYINVTGSSTHIRVHKYWRWAFISFVILCKILLVAAIYYFIQYQHSRKDVRLLQEQQMKAARSSVAPDDPDAGK